MNKLPRYKKWKNKKNFNTRYKAVNSGIILSTILSFYIVSSLEIFHLHFSLFFFFLCFFFFRKHTFRFFNQVFFEFLHFRHLQTEKLENTGYINLFLKKGRKLTFSNYLNFRLSFITSCLFQ